MIHAQVIVQYVVYVFKQRINSFPPGQNVRRFAGDILRSISMNVIFFIFIKISLKIVPKGQIIYRPALV